MSLFGSLMGDVEDDPFFGSHMRHVRQVNNMMNSLFSDPFGMFGGAGPLAIAGPRHGTSLMPFMPQMPSLNRLFPDLNGGYMNSGSSYSSSTVVMASGPNGSPQVYSSTSSTKIGPNGVKETRKTLQDSLTGTKKMSIGHHIGERAHVMEREQNVYSGDAEERQEFINIEEDEAEDFDREFHQKAGSGRGGLRALPAPPPAHALPAPPPAHAPRPLPLTAAPHNISATEPSRRADRVSRPAPRRALRPPASPLATHSSAVREMYGGSHPHTHTQRHAQRHPHRAHAHVAGRPPAPAHAHAPRPDN